MYPLQLIVMPTFSVPATLSTLPATDALTQSYLQAVAASGLMQQLQTGRSLPLYWAEATLIADDPAKGLAQAPAGNHVLDQLLPYMTAAQRQISHCLALLCAHPARQRLAGDWPASPWPYRC